MKAVKLKMPALAVTEHGNLFSSWWSFTITRASVDSSRFSGEVYVAQGAGSRRAVRKPRPTIWSCSPRPTRSTRTLKLVSAGYTEGFYYRPRIDKELLARHSTGLVGEQLLKGEVASALKVEQARPRGGGSTPATSSARTTFSSRCNTQGIEEQKVVNRGIIPLARDLELPLVATNDVHYLRQGDYQPHDILLCISTGKTVNDAQRLRYTGDQFFLKTPEQMAAVFKDHPERSATRWSWPSAATSRSPRTEPPAVLWRP